jgi:DNA repair protein RadC
MARTRAKQPQHNRAPAVRDTQHTATPSWQHPGGKLRELGSASLTDTEVLAILISTGVKGRSAEQIAQDILNRFGSFRGMSDQPLERFLEIKGLGDRKVIRLAAAMELARRCVDQVVNDLKEDAALRRQVLEGQPCPR